MIHMGFLVQRERSYVLGETEEGTRGACVRYIKIPPVGNSVQRLNVSRPIPIILLSLLLWAKEKRRLGEDLEFFIRNHDRGSHKEDT